MQTKIIPQNKGTTGCMRLPPSSSQLQVQYSRSSVSLHPSRTYISQMELQCTASILCSFHRTLHINKHRRITITKSSFKYTNFAQEPLIPNIPMYIYTYVPQTNQAPTVVPIHCLCYLLILDHFCLLTLYHILYNYLLYTYLN
jgi:hypothetical protein